MRDCSEGVKSVQQRSGCIPQVIHITTPQTRILNKLYTLLVKRREGFCCKNTEKHFTVSLNILLEQQCAHYLAGGLS